MNGVRFQLSRSSRAVVRSISTTSDTKSKAQLLLSSKWLAKIDCMSAAGITTRLYDQAVRKRKEKEMATKKREEELAGQVSSWSCLQCGTLHQIGSSERLVKIDKDLFKFRCNSCGYAYEAPLMSFHPTNINSHRSGNMGLCE